MTLKTNRLWALPLTALVGAAAISGAWAQTAFNAGDLIVYRVGDGSAALTSAATAVFLDEYSTNGTLIRSVAAPTAAGNSLTASGTATSEGELNVSSNGQYLALTGYNAIPGAQNSGGSITGSTSTAVPRVVGVVGNGSFDTSTSFTGATFSANNIRGAYTTDGTNIYAVGANTGVVNTTKGTSGAGTVVSSTTANLRDVVVSNNQLYVSTSSGTNFRIGAVGTGVPTATGQTTTTVPGLSATVPAAPYAFFFASLSSTNDTLYVADTNSIDKFSLVGGSYVASGTITGVIGVEGLSGFVSNGTVSLFASIPGTIYSATDTTGYNGTVSGAATSIATATTNENFRGLAYLPQSIAFATATSGAAAPEPGVLPLLAEAGVLALGFVAVRRRRN